MSRKSKLLVGRFLGLLAGEGNVIESLKITVVGDRVVVEGKQEEISTFVLGGDSGWEEEGGVQFSSSVPTAVSVAFLSLLFNESFL